VLDLFAQSPSQTEQTLHDARSTLERISESFINPQSLLVFIVSIITALLLGRVIAAILRRATKMIGARADKIEDLNRVNQLRRLETLIVLSIAAIRTLLVLFSIYFWWTFTHDSQQSTAILGAGALLTVLLSGGLFNILRDVAAGSTMMAEHWYGVGDHIHIEPLPDAQGIVERVTLRSTKLRKVTGEIIWVNNKDIMGVSVTPKGVRTIAIELFVKDIDRGVQLIEDVNLRLPVGALVVARPLSIMMQQQVGKDLWHITALSEAAPGREWLLDKFAIDVLKELDEKHQVLAHEPISRYADSEAERRFARTILNARKSRVQRDNVVKMVAQKHRDGVKRTQAKNKARATARKAAATKKKTESDS
jgi:small-conductance mechanosensitive channel